MKLALFTTLVSVVLLSSPISAEECATILPEWPVDLYHEFCLTYQPIAGITAKVVEVELVTLPESSISDSRVQFSGAVDLPFTTVDVVVVKWL